MNKKGFTLIELLVAIAVFSIVSTVVYSAFKNEIQAYVNQKKFSYAVRQFRAVSYFLSMDIKTVGFDPVDSTDVEIEVAKKDYFSFVRVDECTDSSIDLKRIAFYTSEDQIFRLTQKLSSGSASQMPKDINTLINSPPGGVIEKLAKNISNFEVKYYDENLNEISRSRLDAGDKNSLSEISLIEIYLESEINYWGKDSKTEKFIFRIQGRNLGI